MENNSTFNRTRPDSSQPPETASTGSADQAVRHNRSKPDELGQLLPILRVQRGLPHKVLALFNNEIIVGVRWFSLNIDKDDFIPDDSSRLLSKLYWGKRITLNSILRVTIIKPGTKDRSDKSYRVIIYSGRGTRRFVFGYEDGQRVYQYFRSKAPDCLRVNQDSAAHFRWRAHSGCLLFILIALCLGVLLSILNLFLRTNLTIVVPLIIIGLISLIPYIFIPSNTYYGSKREPHLWQEWRPKRRKRADKREPFRSLALGWLVKVIAVGWYCLCDFWVENQKWFQELTNKVSGISRPGLYMALYAPALVLIYLGYHLCQRVPKQINNPETPSTLYLRAFDDDQRITLQPTSLLARCLGVVVSGLPYEWNKAGGLDGARFRIQMSFIFNLHPVHLIRLFFNKGADTAEEVLTAFFSKFGKVVVLGRPGQWLTTRGAEQIYAEEHSWQPVVMDMLKYAQRVVIQPGISAGVRWEINKTFEMVEPQRVLFSLACFWRRPKAYEDFRLALPEVLHQRMPREVPYLDRPAFLYFGCDWTPHLQLLSYRSPLLWAFVGDALDLKYTLSPFARGIDGASSHSPRAPKRHRVHTGMAWLGIAAFLCMIFFGESSNKEVESHREAILRSPMVKYEDRTTPYSIQLRHAWQQMDKTADSGGLDYWFILDDGVAEIEIISFKLERNNFQQLRMESIREELLQDEMNLPTRKYEGANISPLGPTDLLINGREWTKLPIEIKLPNGLKLSEYARLYLDNHKVIILRGTIVNNDPFYLKLVEETFDSIIVN